MRSPTPIAIALALAGLGVAACSSKPAPDATTTTTTAASWSSSASSQTSARPSPPAAPLNGKYTATTDNGKRTVNGLATPTPNETSTWTITTECTADACTGQITSDQGWNAPAEFAHGRWTVKLDRPDA